MEPKTLFEITDETRSGSRIAVRGAAFSVAGKPHGGLTLSIHVPPQFAQVDADGSVTATLLLNPDEGLAIGEWLRQAFRSVDVVGPGLYDERSDS